MRQLRFFLTCLSAWLLVACSTTSSKQDSIQQIDPLEGFNRVVFIANTTVDSVTLKPVAKVYYRYVPKVVQECVHGVYGNVNDVWSAANSMAQGGMIDFFNTIGRVLFNTTSGGAGCYDIATRRGALAIPNDFDLTLARWGVPAGPYVMVPFFGPSTVRGIFGLAGDWFVPGQTYGSLGDIRPVSVRNSAYVLQWVDKRSNLLEGEKLMLSVALDPYSFIRDSYLQYRNALAKGYDLSAPIDRSAVAPTYEDPAAPIYDDPEE